MEELLSERNPLRVRHNLTLDLEPMPYCNVAKWVPKWKLNEQLRFYGLLGGMPYHLTMIDLNKNLEANLLEDVHGPTIRVLMPAEISQGWLWSPPIQREVILMLSG